MMPCFILCLMLFTISTLSVAQDFRKPTYPKYDYTYSTSGDPFGYYADDVNAIEVNGTTLCEYPLKNGKNLTYLGRTFDTEFGELCPPLGIAFLTSWQPYTKQGYSKIWVCAYGKGSHNGYSFRFMKSSCPDAIVAKTGLGGWVEEINFGKEFDASDFPDVPAVGAMYNLNTLENNPKFAERVKYRAARGLIFKDGEP